MADSSSPEEMSLEEALRIARKGAADYKDVPSVSRTLIAAYDSQSRRIEELEQRVDTLTRQLQDFS